MRLASALAAAGLVLLVLALAVLSPRPVVAGTLLVTEADFYSVVCGTNLQAGDNGVPDLFANDPGYYKNAPGYEPGDPAPAGVSATLTNLPGEALVSPGVLAWTSDGRFNLGVKPCNEFGTLPTTYRLGYILNQDGQSSAITEFAITVTAPPPVRPVANADQYRVPSIAGAGPFNVGANDTRPNNEGITCTWEPVGGLPADVTLTTNGLVSVASGNGRQGPVTFQYRINCGTDELTSVPATVTLTFNTRPVASPLTLTVNEGAFQASGRVTITDPDPQTVTLRDDPGETVGDFSLGSNGSVQWTSFYPEFFGTDSIVVRPFDGQDFGDPVTISVVVRPVNDPPSATNDTLSAIAEDSGPRAIPFAALTGNDSPGPGEASIGDTLTVVAVTAGTGGTVSLDAVNGTVIFTPAPNFAGTATFTYTARDTGGLDATATVSFTVTAVDDAPAASPDPVVLTLDEDASPASVTVTATDVDTPAGALGWTVVDGTSALGSTTVVPSGATATVTFFPAPDAFGTAIATLRLTDGTSTVDIPIQVTVRPVNDPPTATDDDLAPSGEDAPRTIAAADLTANDSPGPGESGSDTLTVTDVSAVTGGTATVVDGDVQFTPATDYAGPASVGYVVTDSGGLTASATARFTVTAVNDPPVIAGGVTTLTYTVPERRAGGSTTVIPLTLPLDDPDGDPLTLSLTDPRAQHTGAFQPSLLTGNDTRTYSTGYRAANGYVGPDRYAILVSDGNGGTLTLTIDVTVTNTNDTPVARDETLSPASPENTDRVIPFADLLANDNPGRNDAAAGDTLTVSAIGTVTGGTARIDGSTVVFTPTRGYTGTATFRYTVRDTYLSTATATASFSVAAVNDPPVFDAGTVPVPAAAAEATTGATSPVTWATPTATDPDSTATGNATDVTCAAPIGVGGAVIAVTSGVTPFPLGTTTVTCTAADVQAPGTEPLPTPVTTTFTVTVTDGGAPVLKLPTPSPVAATGPSGATVMYEATATDAVDSEVDVTCEPASGGTFAIGETTVECSAEDAAGNEATGTFTVTVTDQGAPQVVESTLPASAGGPLQVEATGAGGAVVTYPTPSFTDDVTPAAELEVSCDTPSGTLVPLGLRVITCTAEDEAGNRGAGAFGVLVQDTTRPTFTGGLTDRTVAATDGTGATVTYGTPTASDAVDASVTVECQPPSGSTFRPGRTTVTCTATDDAGNAATGTFTVTVTDAGAPVFTGGLTDRSVAATGPNGAAVTYALPTASDAVDSDVTVTCSPPSGSTFALGTTTVNCTATDDAGNTATGSFTVTVTDQGAPVFTSIPNITISATSNYGAAVNYRLPVATDNAGSPTVTCTPPPGSQFPIGVTTVTCTASDGVNVTTGSFTVTVDRNGFRDPRDPRPGASPVTAPPPTPTPRPARPPRG